MLLSAVIKCSPVNEAILPAVTSGFVNAWFLQLVKSLSEEKATAIHDSQRAKPYSVSPLRGRFYSAKPAYNKYQPTEEYFFRITSIEPALSTLIITKLHSLAGTNFFIEKNEFRITEIIMDSAGHQLAGTSSYEQLYNKYLIRQEDIYNSVRVYYQSPTFFKNGDTSMLLPNPETVFMSIIEKWNTFHNNMLDPVNMKDWIRENLRIKAYDLRTRMWNFVRFGYAGFTGYVEYEDLCKSQSFERAVINMLWQYSFYSQTGAKTALGMGQTALQPLSIQDFRT